MYYPFDKSVRQYPIKDTTIPTEAPVPKVRSRMMRYR